MHPRVPFVRAHLGSPNCPFSDVLGLWQPSVSMTQPGWLFPVFPVKKQVLLCAGGRMFPGVGGVAPQLTNAGPQLVFGSGFSIAAWLFFFGLLLPLVLCFCL